MMYDEPIDGFLALAGEMLRSEAVREAPVKVGRLRGDITVFSGRRGEVSVGNTSLIDYAKYVYYGTAAHVIRPRNGRALHTPYGVFAQVNHPGTSANKYLDRALNNLVSSGRLNHLLGGFADDMSEEMFENISDGLRNIRVG